MKEKLTYVAPKLEIIALPYNDVIATSSYPKLTALLFDCDDSEALLIGSFTGSQIDGIK